MVNEPTLNAKDRIPIVRAECLRRKGDPVWDFIMRMSIKEIEDEIGASFTKRGIFIKLEKATRKSRVFCNERNAARFSKTAAPNEW